MLIWRLLSHAAVFAGFAIGAAVPSMAFAQTASPPNDSQLSIDGLTLGMTMDEAKATINANNPDMIVLTGYLTENIPGESGPQYYAALSNGVLNGVLRPNGPSSAFKNSKVKVPAELTAIKFVGYDPATGAPITDDNAVLGESEPNYGGDFLKLEFTPTDNGGKLYAVIKTHIYLRPSVEAGGPGPGDPTTSQIVKAAQQKYGSTTKTDDNYNNLYWIYDHRDRLLPGTHPDVQACLEDVSVRNGTRAVNGGFTLSDQGSTLWSHGVQQHDTFKLTVANIDGILYQAAKDTSGDDLEAQYKSTVDGLVQGLISAADAGFAYPPNASNPTLRSCNVTLLEVSIFGNPTATEYQEILMKENTALYDNGAPEYVQKKLSQVNGNQPAPAAPNL